MVTNVSLIRKIVLNLKYLLTFLYKEILKTVKHSDHFQD